MLAWVIDHVTRYLQHRAFGLLDIIIATGEPTSKVSRTRVYQLLSEKRSSHYTLLSAAFNPLPPSTDREVFEKQLCNQSG